jgi:hypothetical protein
MLVGTAALLLAATSGCGATQDQILGGAPRPAAVRPAAVDHAPAPAPVDPTGGKVALDRYAASVCAGLAQFGVDYAGARTRRQAALKGSPESARTALLGYYDSLDKAFDRMSATVRGAGTPDLDHGDVIAAGVASTLDDARRAGDRHRPRVQSLPTADRAKFDPAAQGIVKDSDRDVASTMGRLGRFDADPRFRRAFDHAQACRHR